jgi:hypothetical protein
MHHSLRGKMRLLFIDNKVPFRVGMTEMEKMTLSD